MNSPQLSPYHSTRRTIWIYLWILLGISVVFGILHYFLADFRAGRVWWFNLDKERNFSTWFSGLLFFFFGSAAFVAYYWEHKLNTKGVKTFRLPILWIGVGLAGLLMSLDEMTILHENLFWREIRLISEKLGASWIYMTQWQLLFAPVIMLVLGYFVIFFFNRFSKNKEAKRCAFAGIGCWLLALTLEGVRWTFKMKSKWWYSIEVVIEEEMEMFGVIFLFFSIIFYVIDIAFKSTEEKKTAEVKPSRFSTRSIAISLSTVFILLSISGVIVYFFAQKQASTDAPLPRLYKRAKKESIKSQKRIENHTVKLNTFASKSLPHEFWFEDIKNPVSISDKDGEALVRFVQTSLSNKKSPRIVIPPLLQKDTSPRIVFLSFSEGITPARVVIGSAKGITKAIENAVAKVNTLSETDFRPKWVKLDIVRDAHVIESTDIKEPLTFERSLRGIAFDRHSGIAFLPEELVSYTLVNSKQKIKLNNIARYLEESSIDTSSFQTVKNSSNMNLYRFSTIGFFSDGKEIVPLYRGHRLFTGISRKELLSAATQGGRYLSRAIGPDGQFVYTYLPKTDKTAKKYNLLRHAGTVYAMLELYQVTGEKKLLSGARRAIDYLLRSAKPCPRDLENTACIVESGYVKLGGNALAIIALAKYVEITRDRQHLPIMQRLGRWIQSIQKDSGRFSVHKQTYPNGRLIVFTSEYYPGEAMLAMLRLYAATSHKGWLDTAEKSARYLINIRDRDKSLSELQHDHWLMYALNELYRSRPKPLYLNHALRIAGAIMARQNLTPEYRDWFGSYGRPPRSTPAATRSEGLYAAYKLARDFGDPKEAKAILEAIRHGVAFQLQTQFRPESVLYLKNPQRSLGGFHRSLTNFGIRIDYVQHNISSLLGLYHILDEG